MPKRKNYRRQAMASLILGIIGLIAWILPLVGVPIAVLGLFLGINVKKHEKLLMAQRGILFCSLSLIFSILNSAVGAYLTMKGFGI